MLSNICTHKAVIITRFMSHYIENSFMKIKDVSSVSSELHKSIKVKAFSFYFLQC